MADVHERFSKALSAVGAIGKNQKNQHHGYAYRGIDDLLNALHSVLSDHGLFYVPRMVGEAYEEWQTGKGKRMQVARLAYEFVFYAPDGSELVVGPVVGQSADTDDKAPMQALSQAAKYALLQAFCIPTEDMADGDTGSRVEAAGGRVAVEAAPELSPSQQDVKDAMAGLAGEELEKVKARWHELGFETRFSALSDDQAAEILAAVEQVKSEVPF